MQLLRESLVVPVSASVASQHFWDVNLLREFWDSITSVETKYDDGINQECLMSVNRHGKEENIRIIRFRTQDDIIFFNPEPPPMMLFHRGAWYFKPLSDDRCEVIAEREYELILQAQESLEAFSHRTEEFQTGFKKRLSSLLLSFRQSVSPLDKLRRTSAASTN